MGASPPRDPFLGSLVGGRYRISRLLGAGGMAKVYLAHHAGMGLDVALKVLRAELSYDATFVARFAREAEAIARLDHPNVVSVFDFGHAELSGQDGFYYLVMEYIPGRPLDTELSRSGPMPAERVAHILSQIAAGVQNAHSRGIVHRDLKPQNVMLRQRGSDQDFVTILDFGLSRSTTPDAKMPRLTANNDILGTPHYMAPERFRGGDLDGRSDIYAIGVLGYELLTGELPFEGSAPVLVFKHATEPPVPPSRRVEDVHPALEELVLRCMEKEPEARYQSLEDLLLALGHAWRTIARRSSRRTTYAATAAAPPRPSTEDLPDPTVWQSHQMDALSDGPGVIAELRRLVGLRRRHLAELSEAIWSSSPPPERVRALRLEIDLLEDRLDHHGQEVALIEARVGEFERLIREQEAELRVQMVRANVELTCRGVWTDGDEGAEGAPEALREELDAFAATVRPGASGAEPGVRLRYAEQSLGSLHRKQLKEQLMLRERLEEHVAEVRRLETRLEVHYEELARLLDGSVPRGSRLQPQLVAFQKLDGAIAAYKHLLATLEAPLEA